MEPTKQAAEVNVGFGVPPEVVAALRAQAEAEVNAVDEAALLEKFKAEARAKREADLRVRAAEDVEAEAAQNIDAQGFPKEYFEVNIAMGHVKTDLSYVPVGVNGFVWQIARGTWVPVPSVVVNALNEAITEAVVQSEGGLITRPVLRFPFQARPCTEEKYLAAKAKSRSAGKAAVVPA